MKFRYLLFISILLFSCQDAPKTIAESREEKLAKSLCACTEQLLVLNQQLEKNADSIAFRNIAAEFEKARACTLRLGINPSDRPAIDASLGTLCPILATQKAFVDELLSE